MVATTHRRQFLQHRSSSLTAPYATDNLQLVYLQITNSMASKFVTDCKHIFHILQSPRSIHSPTMMWCTVPTLLLVFSLTKIVSHYETLPSWSTTSVVATVENTISLLSMMFETTLDTVRKLCVDESFAISLWQNRPLSRTERWPKREHTSFSNTDHMCLTLVRHNTLNKESCRPVLQLNKL